MEENLFHLAFPGIPDLVFRRGMLFDNPQYSQSSVLSDNIETMLTKKQIASLRESRAHGIGRLLLMARRDFLYRLTQKMEAANQVSLSRSSGALLPFIDLQGTRSVDLARRMGISKQAVTKLVRELLEQGLLERVDDDADGRASLVVFTDRGLDYLLVMHESIRKVEKEYEALVGKAEMQAVRRALNLIAYGKPDEEDPDGG